MSLNTGEFLQSGGEPGNNVVTTNTTPAILCRFAVPPATTLLARIRVIARNPATGATKTWNLASSVKKTGAGAVSNEATQNAAALVSAGDGTPMAGCSIAMFADATDLGIQVTGPAATTINWAAWLDAVSLTD